MMPSLKSFSIEFTRSNAIYFSGDTVEGNVIIDLAKEKTIRELKVSVKGEAFVSWNETDISGNTEFHSAKEQYINFTYPLLKNKEGDERVHLPTGLSRYAFRIALPRNIPSSFEHKYGYVRYTIKAIIDRPWKFDYRCKVAFTVITVYDLNAHLQQCLGIDDEFCESFCCFCANNGLMNTHIRIPITGFVPGQYININIGVKNTSDVEILAVTAKLSQTIYFYAKSLFTRFKKTKKSIILSESKEGPYDNDSNIALQLKVPALPPSELEFCNIINLKYTLHIELHVSGMHFNIYKEYPILIGTIPLQPLPSATLLPALPPSTETIVQSEVTPVPPQKPDLTHCPDLPSANNFLDAFPLYVKSTNNANNIRDPGELKYVHGANEPIASKYPIGFSAPKGDPSV